MMLLNKEELLTAFLREIDICIHLYHKLPADSLEFRPTPGQRSVLELLQYISYMTAGFVKAVVQEEWELYRCGEANCHDLKASDFPEAMEEQKRLLRELFASLSEDQIRARRVTMPWGEEVSLGAGLLEFPYRCIVGYRMQLFLYAKAAGNSDISTANCWAGVDVNTAKAVK